MAFNDIKTFKGEDGQEVKKYSGMPIGMSHHWDYPNGKWDETKVSPDEWNIKFKAIKRRQVAAPDGSGAGQGTEYHWLIIADQRVKKINANEYQTELTGTKFKIGHKRPYWKDMSYTYKEQKPYHESVSEKLKVIKDRLFERAKNNRNKLNSIIPKTKI